MVFACGFWYLLPSNVHTHTQAHTPQHNTYLTFLGFSFLLCLYWILSYGFLKSLLHNKLRVTKTHIHLSKTETPCLLIDNWTEDFFLTAPIQFAVFYYMLKTLLNEINVTYGHMIYRMVPHKPRLYIITKISYMYIYIFTFAYIFYIFSFISSKKEGVSTYD